jgi:hypothetical protein
MDADVRNQEIGLNLVCGSRAISRTERDRQQSAAQMRGVASCLSPQVSRHGVAYGRGVCLRGLERRSEHGKS